MGTEVEAFVGPLDAMRAWPDQLHSAVVYELNPDWGLVPVTEAFIGELSRHFPGPSASGGWVVERWGIEASRHSKLLYFDSYEFGDQGDDLAIVWSEGREVLRASSLQRAIRLLGMDPAEAGIDRYQKTYLWEAAAILQRYEKPSGFAGLVEALRHRNEHVRRIALGSLGRYGSEAQSALPIIAEMARNDPAYGVKLYATSLLATMGSPGAEALRALLTPGQVQDRWGAISSLGKMGAAASMAVPELIRVLQSAVAAERRAAAEALGGIGKEAAQAVPALIDALGDEDQFVRYHSVVALGRIGPAAAAAIPALRRALQDSYSEVPWAVVVALGEIGPPPVAEAISALRTSKSWVTRSSAAKLLGSWGSQAKSAIPALVEALGDPDHSVRSSAATALGSMGEAARGAVPALKARLEDRYNRKAALEAIQRIEGGQG